MDFKQIASIIKAVLKVKVLKKGIPLSVNWNITNRCNLRCQYCKTWSDNSEELTTNQIFSIIDALQKAGTQRTVFTGGEPLLRDDIGDIVDYAFQKGICSTIYSNGLLVSKKIDKLKNLKAFRLSLDGPEEIHDFIRGNGSFKKVMEAVKIVKNKDMRVMLCTVLSKYNLEYIGYIIKMAKSLNVKVAFQSIFGVLLGTDEPNPLVPDLEKYRQTINKLINEKNKNKGIIYNSLVGLKYLYNYPNIKKIRCNAGLIFCHIKPNGDLQLCPKMKSRINLIDLGFRKAVDNLVSSFSGICHAPCRCVEIIECNHSFNLNINSIINLLRVEAG